MSPNPPRERTKTSRSSVPWSFVSLPAGSHGIGMDPRRNLKRGWAFEPLTQTLPKRSALDSKPLPGRTCLSVFKISPLSSLVWWPHIVEIFNEILKNHRNWWYFHGFERNNFKISTVSNFCVQPNWLQKTPKMFSLSPNWDLVQN